MSEPEDLRACARCGRTVSKAEQDDAGWCAACRDELVTRASRWAYAAAAAAVVLVATLVFALVDPTRFLIFWLLLLGIVVFLAFKVARRVAFEMLRTRGGGPGA